jgi:polysaccharide export outer membrane protein
MNRLIYLVFIVVFAILAGPASAQIRANEALDIRITGVPDTDRADISGTYPVSEKGLINLPHIGIIRAAGLDSMSLAKQIENAYRKAEIFDHPTVNVTPLGDKPRSDKIVVVGGQVRHTGPVQFRKGMTLWQAIQAAGGETPFGAIRRVELHRGNAKPKIYDLRDDAAKRVALEENDSVIMPQKSPFEGSW